MKSHQVLFQSMKRMPTEEKKYIYDPEKKEKKQSYPLRHLQRNSIAESTTPDRERQNARHDVSSRILCSIEFSIELVVKKRIKARH